MSQLAIDANYNALKVLEGPPVGGIVDIAATPAGSWSRIMPCGNAGALVSESDDARYKRMLKIGHADGTSGNPLRGIQKAQASAPTTRYSLDLRGWRFRILNTGYEQIFSVVAFENSTGRIVLDTDIQFRESLPAAVEWVLFPNNILPIVIHNIGGPTIDIGITTDPMNYVTNNNNVLPFSKMRANTTVSIPANACDRICVQRSSAESGAVDFSWLEGGIGDYR